MRKSSTKNFIIFPTIKDAKWESINQNQVAREMIPNIDKFNPFLNPDFCERAIAEHIEFFNADYSYERAGLVRDHLWKKSYLEPENMRHLGCDYNVPAGTLVASPIDGVVIDTITDYSEGGWGSAIAIQDKDIKDVLIFAHLAPHGVPWKGEVIKKGQFIGCTGDKRENGGWYPHLHVQGLSSLTSNKNKVFKSIDGYGPNDKSLEDLGMFDPHEMLIS